jgi:hypothetical protein
MLRIFHICAPDIVDMFVCLMHIFNVAILQYRGLSVALLVPCFNEEMTIARVVRDFRSAMPALEIFFLTMRQAIEQQKLIEGLVRRFFLFRCEARVMSSDACSRMLMPVFLSWSMAMQHIMLRQCSASFIK